MSGPAGSESSDEYHVILSPVTVPPCHGRSLDSASKSSKTERSVRRGASLKLFPKRPGPAEVPARGPLARPGDTVLKIQ
jgi:hypothetical protein